MTVEICRGTSCRAGARLHRAVAVSHRMGKRRTAPYSRSADTAPPDAVALHERGFTSPPSHADSSRRAFTHPSRGADCRGGTRTGGVASLDPRLISLTPLGVNGRDFVPLGHRRPPTVVEWVSQPVRPTHPWSGQIFKFVPHGRGPAVPGRWASSRRPSVAGANRTRHGRARLRPSPAAFPSARSRPAGPHTAPGRKMP